MPTRQLVNVQGIENVSQAFKDKIVQIAGNLDTDPNFLMAIMSFETGGSFSPSQTNFAGSKAIGLIQFMPDTAAGLGTSTAALASMTAEQQLDFVEKHFRPHRGKLRTIEDAYMAVLFPRAIGMDNNFVLFREGTKAYTQNKGLDLDGNGRVTKSEAARKVKERLERAGTPPPPGDMTAERVFDTVLSKGDTGPAVQALQDRLVELGFMTRQQVQTGPGTFGPKTQAALKEFQQNHGLEPSGALTSETAQALLQAGPVPAVDHSSTAVETRLPASGTGFETYLRGSNGQNQFGRAATIQAITDLGEAWFALHAAMPFQVGHISLKGGGPFSPHQSHRDGKDVDVRPFRKDGALSPVTINDAIYSHELTSEFVHLVKRQHPDTTIFFNDPQLVGRDTQEVTGHHNHMHVRFL